MGPQKSFVPSFLLICLLWFPCLVNADLQAGLDAYERKDYSSAFEEWQIDAQRGNGTSQYLLGFLFYAGQGIHKDYAKAMEWFQKAAEEKMATAQYYLGEMYHEGHGASHDAQVASRWFLKAAQQGDRQAQWRLAGLYLHYGNSCTSLQAPNEDNLYFQEAVRWYREAARQGSASAQDLLGAMYRGGMGVKKDEKIADEWVEKSAGRTFRGTVSKKAIDDAWVGLAQKGLANAQYKVGEMYLQGNASLPQDINQAGEWLFKATKQGHLHATLLIGYMLSNDVFADEWTNRKYFFDWVQRAAEGGLANAQFLLAERYEAGGGVPQDYLLAHMWYNLTAAQETQWTKWAQKRRDSLAKQMTAYDVSEAQRLAREWSPKVIPKEDSQVPQQENLSVHVSQKSDEEKILTLIPPLSKRCP